MLPTSKTSSSKELAPSRSRQSMTKQVYFEPAGRIHPAHQVMLSYPPDGYEFVGADSPWDRSMKTLIRSDLVYHALASAVDRLLPLHLIKARLEGVLKPSPRGVDLTYAVNHAVFRREPWVIFLECVTAPAGFTMARLRRRRRMVEQAFASSYCRKILVCSELTQKSVLTSLDCRQFEEKLEVVHFAAPAKDFTKTYHADKVRLLFLGTANAPGAFELRGGREVLEAFSHLAQRYDNLELVVRSDVPHRIKAKYQGHVGIRFIEGVIPWGQLDELCKSADIFLFPAYYSTWMAILDAMSYELPVITTDAYANPEMVQDGISGFVIETSTIPRWSEGFTPPNTAKDPNYGRAIRNMDRQIVRGLVDRLSLLIDNPGLRRRMGRAARWEVEEGKFSITRCNLKLKEIFDEATAQPGAVSFSEG